MAQKTTAPPTIDTDPIGLIETELAHRWRLSAKTLQRWRQEGHGPKFNRMSRKIVYPWTEIHAYEKSQLFSSTSERASTGFSASRRAGK